MHAIHFIRWYKYGHEQFSRSKKAEKKYERWWIQTHIVFFLYVSFISIACLPFAQVQQTHGYVSFQCSIREPHSKATHTKTSSVVIFARESAKTTAPWHSCACFLLLLSLLLLFFLSFCRQLLVRPLWFDSLYTLHYIAFVYICEIPCVCVCVFSTLCHKYGVYRWHFVSIVGKLNWKKFYFIQINDIAHFHAH